MDTVPRDDHDRHSDGQCQPQPQQDHADHGPVALGHGSMAQGERGGKWAHTPVSGEIQRDRWMNGQQDEQMDSQMMGQMDK